MEDEEEVAGDKNRIDSEFKQERSQRRRSLRPQDRNLKPVILQVLANVAD